MKMRLLKFRDLINPNVLNDEDMVGFIGDAEYENCDGKLVFGSWRFVGAYEGEPVKDSDWNLDSEIKEETLYDNIQYYLLRNDNGTMCEIKLKFHNGVSL